MNCIVNVKELLDEFHLQTSGNESLACFQSVRNEVVDALFERVNALYNDTADDTEAYLCKDCERECVFGLENPREILQTADEWNENLIADFNAALEMMQDAYRKHGQWPFNDSITYALKKAAMAIDNDFYSFADYAAAVSENASYFKTVLDAAEIAAIHEHPEDYATIKVYAK